ncbi:hypothetical protein ALC57_04033 [Trachymyrmex cornetzi]|uniref:DUF5641 domain-containing protein n=1 Tax=Trachymyrmex cornetzi TaxID=471704 RepID=A0A151JF21_9HYME|nr:hypothetical protein ALC57_04033 [Trachymyrmex cornetzi]
MEWRVVGEEKGWGEGVEWVEVGEGVSESLWSLYVRIVDLNDQYDVGLLCSKSRVVQNIINTSASWLKFDKDGWPFKDFYASKIKVSEGKAVTLAARNNLKLSTTLMSDLPVRINAVKYVIQKCGVDYAWYKSGQRKGAKPIKCYRTLFVRLTTKTVYIELAADLSTETYLNVFKRFIFRRGPTKIYSDNSLNSVGARHELSELRKIFIDDCDKQKISYFMIDEDLSLLTIHFIPAYSPVFPGHSQWMLRNSDLGPGEVCRSLWARGSALSGNSGSALLPLMIPGGERVQIKQHFWKKCSQEYISQFQPRTKWKFVNQDIFPRTMILLKNENPAMTWPMGRIVATPE